MTTASDIASIVSATERRSAVAAIGAASELASENDELIFTLLGDVDSGVRHEAVKLSVRWCSAPGVGRALERAVRSDSLSRRSAAVEVFAQCGVAGLDMLARLVEDENDGLRRLAVDALGMTGHRAAAQLLGPALDDESAAVRSAAVEAMSRVDPTAAAPRIRAVLRRVDEAPSVLLSALLAVDTLELDVDIAALRSHVRNPLTAVPALKLLGRAGDLPTLVDIISSGQGSRLRAALAGFGVAAEARPEDARRLLKAMTLPSATLEKVMQAFDLSAVTGVLILGALLGRTDWFVLVARRADRASLLEGAHRAAALLPSTVEASALLRLADEALESQERAFLSEVGVGLAQRRAGAPKGLAFSSSGDEAPRLDNTTFLRLVKLFHRVAGLVFEPHAAYRVESRLLPRVISSGMGSFFGYVDLLEGGTEAGRRELDCALDLVTVHETYLFREPNQLAAFRDEVLHPLASFSGRQSAMRVLSAGCSTGEEAWTLAMLLDDAATALYEVVGVDISEPVIEKARTGRYLLRNIRDDSFPEWRERYLMQRDGVYEVQDRLRKRVSFKKANLNDPLEMSSLGRFHVIFCRNVIIYLSRKARAELIQRFYDLLEPGGALFLGHSESLINLDTRFRFVPLSREMVYVKPGGDGALWRPAVGDGGAR